VVDRVYSCLVCVSVWTKEDCPLLFSVVLELRAKGCIVVSVLRFWTVFFVRNKRSFEAAVIVSTLFFITSLTRHLRIVLRRSGLGPAICD
jgi:hypothetical protein